MPMLPRASADVARETTNALEMVALHECVERLEAADHAAEHGVAPVEVRIGSNRHEVLTAARVRPRERHAERAALVAMRVELIADVVRGTARAVAAMVAVLRDEIRNDAKEATIIIEVARREREEVLDGEWRFHRVELERDRAALRHDLGARELAAERGEDARAHDLSLIHI